VASPLWLNYLGSLQSNTICKLDCFGRECNTSQAISDRVAVGSIVARAEDIICFSTDASWESPIHSRERDIAAEEILIGPACLLRWDPRQDDVRMMLV
jgi:hypothetical protein